jgi:flagellar biosynthesis chaperone FliJ
MDDARALREIQGIRKGRVEKAEDDLRKAQALLKQRHTEFLQAKEALEKYVQELPSLIESLYSDCIGYVISREFLQDKIKDEALLRAKVEDYKMQVKEAMEAIKKQQAVVEEASQRLNQEQRKLDALGELLDEIKKEQKIAQGRADAKVLDDLASSKFVRTKNR